MRADRLSAGVLLLALCLSSASASAQTERCANVNITVQFDPGSATMNAAALDAVRTGLQRITGCQLERVLVMGFGDAERDPGMNEALAQDRAAAVAQALGANGAPSALTAVRTGSLPAEDSDRANAHMNHDVEVILRMHG